jgi:hypothetical protein
MPFCPVCKSAGKPFEEYTSHFVKNRPGGSVICPTLLNQECNYCHEKGHTIKYCPKLKEKNNRQQHHDTETTKPAPKYDTKKRLERYSADGFVCNGACTADAPSPPSHVYEEYPPLSVLNSHCSPKTKPNRVGVKIPSERFDELFQQEKYEEDISIWAGHSTAYTLEEESIADAEMEQEAEFQCGQDEYDLYIEKKEYSRFERPMPTLEDCTWG